MTYDSFPPDMMPDIERFFRDVHPKLERGQLLYPEVFETAFFPLQRKAELRRMLEVCQENMGYRWPIVMEIGADKGGGFYHFLKALNPIQAIAIEIRGTPYANEFRRAFSDTINLDFFEDSSYQPRIISQVERVLRGEQIDVLFIDGDKSGFYRDFEAYLPMVREGGIVLMHDFRDTGPAEAFREASQHPRVWKVQTILDISDYEETVKREDQGRRPKNSYDQWLRHWKGESCGVGVLYV